MWRESGRERTQNFNAADSWMESCLYNTQPGNVSFLSRIEPPFRCFAWQRGNWLKEPKHRATSVSPRAFTRLLLSVLWTSEAFPRPCSPRWYRSLDVRELPTGTDQVPSIDCGSGAPIFRARSRSRSDCRCYLSLSCIPYLRPESRQKKRLQVDDRRLEVCRHFKNPKISWDIYR